MTADCLAALTAYSFPGNVRELESEMARLVALSSADVPCGADLLNARIRSRGNGQPQPRRKRSRSLRCLCRRWKSN